MARSLDLANGYEEPIDNFKKKHHGHKYFRSNLQNTENVPEKLKDILRKTQQEANYNPSKR